MLTIHVSVKSVTYLRAKHESDEYVEPLFRGRRSGISKGFTSEAIDRSIAG